MSAQHRHLAPAACIPDPRGLIDAGCDHAIARRTFVMWTATNDRFSTSTLRLSAPGSERDGAEIWAAAAKPDMRIPSKNTIETFRV